MTKILNQELKHFIDFFKRLTIRDQLKNDEIPLLLKLYRLYGDDVFYEDGLKQRFHEIQPDQLNQMIAVLLQLDYLQTHHDGGLSLRKTVVCQFQKMKLI